MKITAIKQQVKRADRFSIYIDDKYAFSLSQAELQAIGLKINQEFAKDELEDLRKKAIIDKGYDRTLNLISHRTRSEWELRDYLKRKDYDPENSDAIIEKLRQRGWVDDKNFAERWVSNRRLLKATSKRRLSQELKQKRVPDDIIQEVVGGDETEERQVLRDLIERKRRQTKYQDDMKLMQYLARQGFGYDDIKSALNES